MLPEVANVGFEALMTVDTLGLAEDGVVGGKEEIVEKFEQTGILVLLLC
jgi:hypothetical protein